MTGNGSIFPMAKRKTLLRPEWWRGGNTSLNIKSGSSCKLNTIQGLKGSEISSVKLHPHLQIILVSNKTAYSLWLTLRVISPPPVTVVCTRLRGQLPTQESHSGLVIFGLKASPKQFSALTWRHAWRHSLNDILSHSLFFCATQETPTFCSPSHAPQRRVVFPAQPYINTLRSSPEDSKGGAFLGARVGGQHTLRLCSSLSPPRGTQKRKRVLLHPAKHQRPPLVSLIPTVSGLQASSDIFRRVMNRCVGVLCS